MFSRKHKNQPFDGLRRKNSDLSHALGDLGIIASPRSTRSVSSRFRPGSSATTDVPFHLEGTLLISHAGFIYAPPLHIVYAPRFVPLAPLFVSPLASTWRWLLMPYYILEKKVTNRNPIQANLSTILQQHAAPSLSNEGGLQATPLPAPLHLEE